MFVKYFKGYDEKARKINFRNGIAHSEINNINKLLSVNVYKEEENGYTGKK